MSTMEGSAYQLIYKSNIKSLPITEKQINALIEAEGYRIVSYVAGQEIIQKLGLQKHAAERKAFVFNSNHLKIVFYDEKMPSYERRVAITHELLHSIFEHPSASVEAGIEDVYAQEDESLLVTLYFLAPLCVLKDMEIETIADLEKTTLLAGTNAERMYARLRAYKGPKTPIEKSIIHNFRAEMGYKEPDEPEPISVDLDKLNKKRHKWYEWAFTGFLFATAVSLLIVFISLLPRLKRPDHFDVTPEQYEWLHPSSSDSAS